MGANSDEYKTRYGNHTHRKDVCSLPPICITSIYKTKLSHIKFKYYFSVEKGLYWEYRPPFTLIKIKIINYRPNKKYSSFIRT